MKRISSKLIVVFLTTFCCMQFFFHLAKKRQDGIDFEKTKILQENIRDRFRRFLEIPLSVGMIGKDYFSHQKTGFSSYGQYFSSLLEFNKDILGLNVLNKDGVIVNVYPEMQNQKSLGKKTQHLVSLMKSFGKNEPFWFSPPFKLYQGEVGFAFYVPIVRDSKLIGWFATVISSHLLQQEFRLEEFLKIYHLNIIDHATNLTYYTSGIETNTDHKKFEFYSELFGRKILYQSLPKSGVTSSLPWSLGLIVSLLMSLLSLVITRLYMRNKKSRRQFKDIEILLRMTSKEALNKLVDLQSQGPMAATKEAISYITNLIEQVDLLQSLAQTREGLPYEQVELLPVLYSEIENLKELSEKKNIIFEYSVNPLKDVVLSINSSLFENTVIHNTLTYAILNAQNDSTISIEYSQLAKSHFLQFKIKSFYLENPLVEAVKINRRIDVAKKGLQIYNGDLLIQKDLQGGLVVKLILPF